MRTGDSTSGRPTRRPLLLAFSVAVAFSVLTAFACSAAPRSVAAASALPASNKKMSSEKVGSSARFTSRNWDGYIAYSSSESTDFKAVSASWVEPTVKCPKPDAWTVFWVGLDGWFDDTVEQGGSSAECVDSKPEYFAWWEMYPTNDITFGFRIAAGDKMSASVHFESGKYVITVTDHTSGKSLEKREKCASNLNCERSSADVIAEDVGRLNGKFYPLADYGSMKFASMSVTDDGGDTGSMTDSDWLNAAVTEEEGSTVYATVSPLASRGTSFTAKWKHA